MADVTLEIIRDAQTHDLSYNPEKEARRYRRGDIFEVHKTDTFCTLDGGGDWHITEGIGTTRFLYIHVRNVPAARAKRIRRVLKAMSDETKTIEETDPTDPDGPKLLVQGTDNHRRRKWRIPRSVIPALARDTLLSDGEITVEWTTFRDKIRRKISGTRFDPSLDDESNAVSDTDLPDSL